MATLVFFLLLRRRVERGGQDRTRLNPVPIIDHKPPCRTSSRTWPASTIGRVQPPSRSPGGDLYATRNAHIPKNRTKHKLLPPPCDRLLPCSSLDWVKARGSCSNKYPPLTMARLNCSTASRGRPCFPPPGSGDHDSFLVF